MTNLYTNINLKNLNKYSTFWTFIELHIIILLFKSSGHTKQNLVAHQCHGTPLDNYWCRVVSSLHASILKIRKNNHLLGTKISDSRYLLRRVKLWFIYAHTKQTNYRTSKWSSGHEQLLASQEVACGTRSFCSSVYSAGNLANVNKHDIVL